MSGQSAYFLDILRVLGPTELDIGNVLGEQDVQVGLFHEIFGVHQNVFDMNELIGDAARARLGPQRQSNDGAIVVAVLEQWHVEDLLQRFELVLKLLDVARIVLEIEDSHVAALLLRETFVGVNECDFVAAEYGYEVGYVKERDEFARLTLRRRRCATGTGGARVLQVLEPGAERQFRLSTGASFGGRGRRRRLGRIGVIFATNEYLVPMLVLEH